MNTSVSSKNWLNSKQNLTIKNYGPQTGSVSTRTTAISPFRMVDTPRELQPEAPEGSLTREGFLQALGKVAGSIEDDLQSTEVKGYLREKLGDRR